MAKDKIKEKQSYDPLISKTWVTKGTRFTADERLRAKHKWSTLSLAMLALYLIALSSAEMLNNSLIQDDYKVYIPMIVLFLSLFILIITLIENSKNYLLQADKMHQCALEIQSIYHRLQLAIKSKKDTYETREQLLQEYDNVLLKYPNHEERAYKIFRASNYMEEDVVFGVISHPALKFPIAKLLLVWYWALDFWLYLFFIFAPLAALFLTT